MSGGRLTQVWLRIAAATTAVALLIAPAQAQRDMPNATPIQSFRLVDWDAELFVRSHYAQEQQSRSGSQVDQADMLIETGLRLGVSSYIYHPRLVQIDGAIELGGTLSDVSIGDQSRDEQSYLLGYDLNAQILAGHRTSGRVFALMTNRYVSRDFARPVKVDRRAEGFEVFFRRDISYSISVEHRDVQEESDLRDRDEQTYYIKLNAVDGRDRDYFTELTYDYQNTDETSTLLPTNGGAAIVADLPTRRHRAMLRNRWQWGDGPQRNRLDGQARWEHREGFFERDLAMITQRLELVHHEMLRSFYEVFVEQNETSDRDDFTMRGQAGLILDIYDSLDATITIEGENRDLIDGSQSQYGVILDMDYVKITPIGLLSSQLGLSRVFVQEAFSQGFTRITDETVSLAGVGFVALSETNVSLGSVVVTNPSRTITYIEGVDYELRQTGSLTEIRRLVGGSIPAGEPVLVDYTALKPVDSNYHQDQFDFSFRLDLDDIPVAPYFRVRIRNERLDEGDDPGNLEDQRQYLAGIELMLDPLTVNAEYEIQEFQLTPSWEAYRLRATLFTMLAHDTSLTFSASYERLEYTNGADFGLLGDEAYLVTYSANGHLATKISPTVLMRIEALYQRSEGRDDGEFIRLGADIAWRAGRLDLEFGGYYSQFIQDDSDGNVYYLWGSVSREF